jgi:phenylacetate-CoA ligase
MEMRTLDENILFLNQTSDPSLWTDDDVHRIADELEEFKPMGLEADPAYLAFFVVRLARLGRKPFKPKFIDLSYEFPSRLHVRAIRNAFGVPVLDAYGSTECGFVFMECEAGRLHHNTAWSHVEVVPVGGIEGAGMLVVTPLRNSWLNLVRFETGDLVRLAKEPCRCGSQDGLVLEGIEGRVKDCLIVGDRFVTVRTVDRALASVEGLLHYKLVQRAPEKFELDLVEMGDAPLQAEAAASALEPVLGARPQARVVPSVSVEASGKFRLCRAAHVDVEKLLRVKP